MKKKAGYVAAFLAVCLLAYIGGYKMAESRAIRAEKNRVRPRGQKERTVEQTVGEHYVARIEQEMLFIYEMPENIIYDLVETDSIHLPAAEVTALQNGVVFDTLPEVYEFLENSMS